MASPAVTYQFTNGVASDATQVNQNFSDILNAMTDGTKSFNVAAIVSAVSTLGIAAVSTLNTFTLPAVPAAQSLLQTSSGGVITASNEVPGVITGTAAAAGIVRELMTSVISTSTNFTTTATFQNITSLSLTAGDWDVHGQILFNLNSSTTSNCAGAISLFSANTQTDHISGDNVLNITPPTASNNTSVHIIWNVRSSSTQTVYLKGSCDFSAGNPQFRGKLYARRR